MNGRDLIRAVVFRPAKELHRGYPIRAIRLREFENAVLRSDMPVVLDFFATWCGPCRSIDPFLEEAAWAFDGQVRVYKADVDKEPLLAEKLKVMCVPTVVYFRAGRELSRTTGAISWKRWCSGIWKVLGQEGDPSPSRSCAGVGGVPEQWRRERVFPTRCGKVHAPGAYPLEFAWIPTIE